MFEFEFSAGCIIRKIQVLGPIVTLYYDDEYDSHLLKFLSSQHGFVVAQGDSTIHGFLHDDMIEDAVTLDHMHLKMPSNKLVPELRKILHLLIGRQNNATLLAQDKDRLLAAYEKINTKNNYTVYPKHIKKDISQIPRIFKKVEEQPIINAIEAAQLLEQYQIHSVTHEHEFYCLQMLLYLIAWHGYDQIVQREDLTNTVNLIGELLDNKDQADVAGFIGFLDGLLANTENVRSLEQMGETNYEESSLSLAPVPGVTLLDCIKFLQTMCRNMQPKLPLAILHSYQNDMSPALSYSDDNNDNKAPHSNHPNHSNNANNNCTATSDKSVLSSIFSACCTIL